MEPAIVADMVMIQISLNETHAHITKSHEKRRDGKMQNLLPPCRSTCK